MNQGEEKEKENDFRSPICCVLGHVDVGKTQLLDSLRNTTVQKNEHGGITQQIGATYFDKNALKQLTKGINNKLDIPGLLFIDTPGHDCFTNLRIRGIEIADLAIVVVDVIKGIEKHTVECIQLLTKYKTPFVIALNKIDKIMDWVSSNKQMNLKNCLKKQSKTTKNYLDDYINQAVCRFAENEINAAVYYNNPNDREFVSMVPISAHTKEGVPDLLAVVSLVTQKYMKKKITFHENITRGYIMDIYKSPSMGTVVNAILVDGVLNRGDRAIFIGNSGCIDTSISGIFEPDEGKEMKGKTKVISRDKVFAARGIMLKINHVNDVLPGTKFLVYTDEEGKNKATVKLTKEREKFEEELLLREMAPRGVYLNSPSFGPLEALWNICTSEGIPVAGANVGPITKVELIKVANSICSDKKDKDGYEYSKQFGTILNYQSNASKEISEMATREGVTIIEHEIIYHLLDAYKAFKDNIYNKIKERHPSIIPDSTLEILPQYVFHKKDPLIFGVKVKSGILKKGVQIATMSGYILGDLISIEKNKSSVDEAKENEEVCLKIAKVGDTRYEYGIHFTEKDILHNHIENIELEFKEKYIDVFEEN